MPGRTPRQGACETVSPSVGTIAVLVKPSSATLVKVIANDLQFRLVFHELSIIYRDVDAEDLQFQGCGWALRLALRRGCRGALALGSSFKYAGPCDVMRICFTPLGARRHRRR